MNARPEPDGLRQPGAAAAQALPPFGAQMPVHDARRLTGPEGQARIVLDGRVYALRITRAGKLILTK